MKAPHDWLMHICNSGSDHRPDCICERCKEGNEAFLLESDIKAIQDEAFKAGLMKAAQLAERAIYAEVNNVA